MPPSQVVTERVVTRGYELDADSVLPLSAFMRYLEHGRWKIRDHLPIARFLPGGVVRAQRLVLREPVSFDVPLDLTTWVSRVGRTSLDMSHDLVRVEDGVVVASSAATLVALGEDRRPTPVGAGLSELLVDESRAELPGPEGSAPLGAFEVALQVRPSDHDRQGHVNQARYGDFLVDALRLGAAAGRLDGVARGRVGSVVLHHEQETRAGDALVARAWPRAEAPTSFEVELARGASEVVARARVEFSPGG